MYTRQLKKYQYGGVSQQSNPQQIMQQVAQMLQQGADPQEVLQQLIQSGIPQEQAAQMIQGVMGQMQQGEEQEAQPEMRRGGMYQQGGTLTDAEAKILYKNPRYVQSAVDAEKQAFIGPPEYRAPQTQLASQYIPDPNAVGANPQVVQVPVPVPVFIPRSKPKIKRTVPQNRATGSATLGNVNRATGSAFLGIPKQNRDTGSATTEGVKLNKADNRRKEWEKRQMNSAAEFVSILGEVARPLAKPIPALNYVIEKYDEAISDIKSKDLNQMKRSAIGNGIEAVSLGLPYAKIPKLLKSLSGLSKTKYGSKLTNDYAIKANRDAIRKIISLLQKKADVQLTKLATKYPFSEKLYPYGNSLLSSGVKAGMKQLPNAATKYERTLNATTKGLNAGSKSVKPLITPFSSATRTFYGGVKGLSQKIPNNVIQNLANRSGVNMNKLKKIIKNLEKMEANYKLGGTFKKY